MFGNFNSARAVVLESGGGQSSMVKDRGVELESTNICLKGCDFDHGARHGEYVRQVANKDSQ